MMAMKMHSKGGTIFTLVHLNLQYFVFSTDCIYSKNSRGVCVCFKKMRSNDVPCVGYTLTLCEGCVRRNYS